MSKFKDLKIVKKNLFVIITNVSNYKLLDDATLRIKNFSKTYNTIHFATSTKKKNPCSTKCTVMMHFWSTLSIYIQNFVAITHRGEFSIYFMILTSVHWRTALIQLPFYKRELNPVVNKSYIESYIQIKLEVSMKNYYACEIFISSL